MSPELLQEWQDFYELEPWGFPEADLRGAVLASTVARAAGADVTPKDFSLSIERAPTPESEFAELARVFGPGPAEEEEGSTSEEKL